MARPANTLEPSACPYAWQKRWLIGSCPLERLTCLRSAPEIISGFAASGTESNPMKHLRN
jgi:hypothetical protein